MVKKTLISCLLISFFLPSLGAEAGYGSLRRKWTKSERIYTLKSLDTVLLWKTTYFSPEFRRAKTQKHIQLKYLDPMEAAQVVEKEEKRQEKYHEFFLSIFTQKDFQQFSMSPDSFWKMILTAEDGTVVHPVSIEMVPVGPYEQKMFPYLNRWSKAYRVLFPKAPLGNRFKATLRSVAGESTIQWKAD